MIKTHVDVLSLYSYQRNQTIKKTTIFLATEKMSQLHLFLYNLFFFSSSSSLYYYIIWCSISISHIKYNINNLISCINVPVSANNSLGVHISVRRRHLFHSFGFLLVVYIWREVLHSIPKLRSVFFYFFFFFQMICNI